MLPMAMAHPSGSRLDPPPRGAERHAFPAQHVQPVEARPVLVRIREPEALEKVAGKIGRPTVFGNLDDVLKQRATSESYDTTRDVSPQGRGR